MTGSLIIRAYCPQCNSESDLGLVSLLGRVADQLEECGACGECGDDMLLRAHAGDERSHGPAEHELLSTRFDRAAGSWGYVCSCSHVKQTAGSDRCAAVTAWGRHAATAYVRGHTRELVASA